MSCRFASSVKNVPMACGVAQLSSVSSSATWKLLIPAFSSVASMFAPPRMCQRASAAPLSETVIIASSASSSVNSVPAYSNDPSAVMSSGSMVIVSE